MTIEQRITSIEKALRVNVMIDENEACKILGITKRTLANYVYNGRIPKSYFTTAVNGARFFNKNKLIGL